MTEQAPKTSSKKIILIAVGALILLCCVCMGIGLVIGAFSPESAPASDTITPAVEVQPTQTQTPAPTGPILDVPELIKLSPPEAVQAATNKFGQPRNTREQEDGLEAEYNWLLEEQKIFFSILYYQEQDGSFSEYLIIISAAFEDGHTNESLLQNFNVSPQSPEYNVLVNPSDLKELTAIWVSPDYIDHSPLFPTLTPEP